VRTFLHEDDGVVTAAEPQCVRHYRRNRQYYIDKARIRRLAVIEEVRAWLLIYLSEHPCVDCGETDVRALEFDHRDASDKTVAVAILARSGYGLARVRREIEKCDVRCANCHRIRTHTQRAWWGATLVGARPERLELPAF
jgi:hypothetical protein